MRRRTIDVKVGDKVLLETHFLSSKANKEVVKLGLKLIGLSETIKIT